MGEEELTGAALDAAIAREVFGYEVWWKRVRGAAGEPSESRPWRAVPCTADEGTPGHSGRGYPCRGGCATMVPRYSESLDAALELFFDVLTLAGHAEIVADMEDYGREPGQIATVIFGLDTVVGETGNLVPTIARCALRWARLERKRHVGSDPRGGVPAVRPAAVPGPSDAPEG